MAQNDLSSGACDSSFTGQGFNLATKVLWTYVTIQTYSLIYIIFIMSIHLFDGISIKLCRLNN